MGRDLFICLRHRDAAAAVFLPLIMQKIVSCLKTRMWVFIIIAFVGMSFLFGSLHIYGDGAGNYFLYRQILDHNWTLSIADPPLSLPGSYIFVQGSKGWSTFYQIGTPLVWALLTPVTFFLPDVPPAFAAYFGLPDFLLNDGFIILLISSLLSVGILLMMAHTLRTVFHFSQSYSIFASLAAFAGLSSWYYAFVAPSYTHTVALFFLTAAFALFFSAMQRPSRWVFVAVGMMVGIAALARVDALLYAVVFAWALAVRFRRAAWRPLIRMTIPCLVIAALQFLLWLYVFGGLFPSDRYRPDEFSLLLHVADVLFSASHGFFLWSPIALVGCIGIIVLLRDRRDLTWIAAIMSTLALLVYALFYGAWEVWWGGLSFGQRFLIPLTPFVALGVAAVLSRLQSLTCVMRLVGAAVITAIVAYSFCLAIFYPTVAQWGTSIYENITPFEVLQGTFRQYRARGDVSWRKGWRAWYNATPRPVHFISGVNDNGI